MNSKIVMALAAGAAAVVAGCAAMQGPTDPALEAKAVEMMKVSFKEKGQAKLDRLNQDETQALCSVYTGHELPKDVAAKIERANMATIKWPADGKLVGDWKQGEKIAQEGRGFQYSDDPKGPSGANCYACHQLTRQEISYGTIGPSLYNFGKIRGFNDETRRYAWGKISNSQAYNACSNMPRFGHNGVLTEQQIRDVVALLVDPASPVNQ
ncbi:MAG: sulfur oxidation c-type cytochrome SoxX [Burkholderiales bacterium]